MNQLHCRGIRLLGWAGSFFFLLIGFAGVVSGDIIAGLGMGVAGIALLPILREIQGRILSPWMRMILFASGFGIFFIAIPKQNNAPDSIAAEATAQIEQQNPVFMDENVVQEINEVPINDDAPIMVVSVTDGDTLAIRLEDGSEEKVRLIGIDAPETRPTECFAAEATAYLRKLADGKVVVLESEPKDDRDNFGRLLRYLSVLGTDIGAVMIRDGYAHSYTKYPHSRMEMYGSLEQEARQANRGLWGSICSQSEVEEVIEVDSPDTPVPVAPTQVVQPTPIIIPSVGNSSPQIFQEQPAPPKDQECVIKGNVNSDKEKIYHAPGCKSYSVTKIKPEEGDRWFCTEEDARASGFRRAGNC